MNTYLVRQGIIFKKKPLNTFYVLSRKFNIAREATLGWMNNFLEEKNFIEIQLQTYMDIKVKILIFKKFVR